jgi:hypothetical protein
MQKEESKRSAQKENSSKNRRILSSTMNVPEPNIDQLLLGIPDENDESNS